MSAVGLDKIAWPSVLDYVIRSLGVTLAVMKKKRISFLDMTMVSKPRDATFKIHEWPF